jgi:hypothetical protein
MLKSEGANLQRTTPISSPQLAVDPVNRTRPTILLFLPALPQLSKPGPFLQNINQQRTAPVPSILELFLPFYGIIFFLFILFIHEIFLSLSSFFFLLLFFFFFF